MSFKEQLKDLVGPAWRRRVHRLSRLRWATKLQIARGLQGGDRSLRRRAAYVLWDPETESFSYELADEGELVAGIAQALGADIDQLAGYARETHSDPELHDRLAHHLRWRFDVKHRPPLGHRLGWYVIARALKPAVIVETGIYDGLGSLALLRAIERNAAEGAPGELMAFDLSPDAGSLVRQAARGDWRPRVGSTRELLEPALEGRQVGLMIQDTPHDDENQRFEFGATLAHAAGRLVLVDGSGGWAKTLPALCAERGGSHDLIPARSRDHVSPGATLSIGVFDTGP